MEIVEPIRDKRQLEAIKKVLRGSNLRDYALFVLGINSGLRVSDLLGLKVGDVVDAKENPRDRIRLRELKTGKLKDFPLGPSAGKAVCEYLATRSGYQLSEPLFLSRKCGGAIGRTHAYAIINQAARSVGITDRIGTHSMRKTFGFWAYREGKDVALIQKLLNHSHPAVTLRYIGVSRDQMDNVYLTINL